MRDSGHVFSVEVLAVPVNPSEHTIDHAEQLGNDIRDVDWKVQDVVVAVVRELEDTPENVLVRGTAERAADTGFTGA